MTEHFLTAFDTYALRSTHPEVRRLKRQNAYHSAHGNKVWRSSFVLMDYLVEHPLPRQVQVMDLGCGWGLSGIFTAKWFQADVTSVDIDPGVEPFLNLQADINGCEVTFRRQNFERISSKQLTPYHTLIGADICFWDSMTGVLFNLIRRARKAGVEQVLIADPGRPPFWELADRCRDAWGTEYVTRTIGKPFITTKHILVVRGSGD